MKRQVLRLLASAFLLFAASATGYATGPITSANNQLRHLFQYVPNPNSPSVKYFYQLGAHIIDSAYFDVQSPLTTNCDTWF